MPKNEKVARKRYIPMKGKQRTRGDETLKRPKTKSKAGVVRHGPYYGETVPNTLPKKAAPPWTPPRYDRKTNPTRQGSVRKSTVRRRKK